MLSENKLSLLKQFVQNASKEEIIWSKGYLSGILDGGQLNGGTAETTTVNAVALKPLIVYGTETGNSKKVASNLLASFKKNKIQAKAIDISQYNVAKLEKESLVLFVVSTQGEGEFPQNAVAFYDELKASSANLNKVSFAIFGLGDSSYPLFCNAGILLEEVLIEKGAKAILPLVKADVDYADTIAQWETDLNKVFKNIGSSVVHDDIKMIPAATISHKKNYIGKISHKVVLNDIGSNKQTHHIEIESDDEIQYVPGDALGVVPKNKKEEIDAIAAYFNSDNAAVLIDKNVRGLSKKSLEAFSKLFEIEIKEDKANLIDVIKKYHPKKVSFDEVVALLLPISPRLYSISSSSEAHDGQVHLTVTLNQFTVDNELKSGLASEFLADFPVDEPIEFYIHKNQNFRLPSEDTDMIMIGPGTGIAPFRSFLAERDAVGAEGKNWLFFGEQHFVLDFYYQTEIQEWLTTGVLTKLDTAFSRDQERKIYVQDRIKEKAKDFNNWLENGASIYICGQKNPMSQDVEKAIVEVIAKERNISEDDAKLVLEELENQGKYQKDVY
jgi:sulfite reductase (NADPH) flavoprotein alpha-component